MLIRFLTLMLSLMLTFSSSANLFKQNKPQYLPSEQAFIFSSEQKTNTLKLLWQISPNYYLYKNKISITSENGEIKPIVLPQGEPYFDEFYGNTEIYTKQLEINVNAVSTQPDFNLTIEYQGCTKGFCYPPEKQTVHFIKNEAVTSDQKFANFTKDLTASTDINQLENNPISLFWFLILGLGLAFTPCVMPMLPLLSAIVIGQKNRPNTKKAFLLSFSYVQGMALTYTLLGLLVVSIGLPFQIALQSAPVLIGLSLIFILFALSMFGLFDIKLPNNWQQKLNNISQNQQGGSIKGAFVMGMVAGLVASPCTSAPLSGALLYVAQTGNFLIGGTALYLLGLGMGIPLIFITLFGNKILPKSGEWLIKVKIAFGFVMLALPIFLLNRILPQYIEPFMWSSLALVFLAWLSFQLPKNKIWHKLLHILLFMGLAVSSKPYLDLFFNPNISSQKQSSSSVIYVDSFADLQQKVTAYKGQKIMLDLYADWCVACEMLEEETFSDPKVKQKLQQMVVLKADLTKNTIKNKELMKKLNILGLPSILFFNEQGQEQPHKRINGFMDAEDFLKKLNDL
ncbi:protein-disulfide reductase DsbD [Pasteurella atlantica]|uniref:Protein-disulfide reductase DsbD n=2 Tax=Pasteurellaceae TaxID=712 RepID=A0ACC6HJJ9_9PAST|nr:protein-disulfide reductase DsbD [Pasteurella atlantica]MDP8051003.1 protein-disulfide reductase DsbD [Pasteurella atlantica]MDP8104299.1 protein-disulfide reductase DsbD [Pasteurella atlantica]MDP8147659.1 protein-disulfide reductase DsbD [Pasteurella atlantica]